MLHLHSMQNRDIANNHPAHYGTLAHTAHAYNPAQIIAQPELPRSSNRVAPSNTSIQCLRYTSALAYNAGVNTFCRYKPL